MPTLRIITLPSSGWYPNRLSKEKLRPVVAAVIDDIIKALTTPLTEEEKNPKPPVRDFAKPIKFTGKSYSAVLEEINQSFLDSHWTDALPVVPPTREAVDRMLTGTSRSPDEELGEMTPENGIATIEKVAINAVMAGARTEYLPVIIAAVECLVEPAPFFKHLQMSAASCFPLVVVNGPIAEEIGMNSGLGYLGYGWRANSSIGRAISLCMTNLGHVWPGINFMGLTGRPEGYNFTFPENEKLSPWEPYHVELGYKPDQSTVTVFSSLRFHRGGPGGIHADTSEEAVGHLASLVKQMSGGYLFNVKHLVIVLAPAMARLLAELGYTKESLKQWAFENGYTPSEQLTPHDREMLRTYIEEANAGKRAYDGNFWVPPGTSLEILEPGGRIPPFASLNQIAIYVAGGEPAFTVLLSGMHGFVPSMTKLVHGATLTKAGVS